MRPDIAEEALPFSEKETQGNGWRFPKRKTSEQSEHCSDVAEKVTIFDESLYKKITQRTDDNTHS